MNRLLRIPLVILACSAGAQAAEPFRGMLLYENNCYACHFRYLHYRPARKVHSLDGLRRQIEIWQGEMRLGWNARDIDDVQAYLNRRYYGFREERLVP